MIKEAIENLTKKSDLNENEARQLFEEIMSGKASSADIKDFLNALKAKGETVDEITGAARAMREKSLKVNTGFEILVDTCGTGGSSVNTFNISTAAAFVVAGCGVKVAKHGNRSASCQCGSADVLEALGVKLDADISIVQRCIREIDIGFMFAPLFHQAMKYAAGPRKEIGKRTIFNILGPLSNPAGAVSQVIGVSEERLTEIVADVLKRLGTRRAFVVYGMDGLDEITINGKTKITELNGAMIETYHVTPAEFGLKEAKLDTIKGGTVQENAKILLSVLKGEKSPRRDVVLMNAGVTLVAGFSARDFKEGVQLAAVSIDSGAALDKLERLIEMTKK